ncbi:MAG: metal-dependent hydrolase [Candidatus Nanoarchaeia archaeon]
MPHAVTHVLIAIIVADVIRDYIAKDKKQVPLYLVLVAGIAGLLPDIDVMFYWFLRLISSIDIEAVHRTFSHTLFVPAIFLGLGFATYKTGKITKYKISISDVAFFTALGVSIHLLLDFILTGWVMPFYPLSYYSVGLNLIPMNWQTTIVPGIDAILLVVWIIHEYKNHRIKDFI